MNKIGDVLVNQGDCLGALEICQKTLELREKILATNPTSATFERYRFVVLWKTAPKRDERKDWEAARASIQNLQYLGEAENEDQPFLEYIN